mmetsp:Transcript_24564/g.75876  ORF Transcript_24564/g.75876 Transcript_24564/m.75876 type:complete len:363 (-) Transcript_24564:694-1782(-)
MSGRDGDETVDDEAGDGDARAAQVGVQGDRLRDRRRLGQGHDEQLRLRAHQLQRRQRGRRLVQHLARFRRAVLVDVRLVRARLIQQHQRVAGGGGVDDDEPVLAGADLGRERVEHRELLGARRVEFLPQQSLVGLGEGAALGLGLGALRVDGALDVLGGSRRGVDGVDADVEARGQAVADRQSDVRGGVRGRHVDAAAPAREREAHARRDCGLPSASFSHEHHHARRPGREAIDRGRQVLEGRGLFFLGRGGGTSATAGLLPLAVRAAVVVVCEESAEGVEADEVEVDEREAGDDRQGGGRERFGDGVFLLGRPAPGHGVVGVVDSVEDAVEHELRAADADLREFRGRALGLFQSGDLGPRH